MHLITREKLCFTFSNLVSKLCFSLYSAILLWENKLTALFSDMVQEDGIGLMTVIKGTNKFRRSRRHSYASDFLPPSMTELNYVCDQIIG